MNAGMAYTGGPFCDRVGSRRPLLIGCLSFMTLFWVSLCIGTSIYSKKRSVAAAKVGIAMYFCFSATGAVAIAPMQGFYTTEV